MRDRPPKDEQIEMVIKGALPHFHKQMQFFQYPTLKALHQDGIRIEDEEIYQPKNPYRKPAHPTQISHATETSLIVNAVRNCKYSNFNLTLSKFFIDSNKKAFSNPLNQDLYLICCHLASTLTSTAITTKCPAIQLMIDTSKKTKYKTS